MSVAVCSCPAKINFGLQVKFRRPDGYHEIESVFLPIDFADTIEITRPSYAEGESGNNPKTARPPLSSELTTENLIPVATAKDFEAVSERGDPRKNLVMRSLECINADQANPIQLHLHLKKRIPSGAGLGGGSSDAGTLLRWLVQTGRVDPGQAFRCAKGVGADVPFFLNPVPSIVTGIGDEIEPVRDSHLISGLSRITGVLALSSFVIPTKNAYLELKRPLQSASDRKSGSHSEGALKALLDAEESVLAEVRNDFEEFAFRLHPELERVKKAFRENGAIYSSMTGSGSAVYGLFHSGHEARAILGLETELAGFRFVPFRFLN